MMSFAYYAQGGLDSAQRLKDFMDYLEQRYGGLNAKARALDCL